jgi:talin
MLRDKAPGQKECDSAIEKLSARIRDLDQTSLAAVSQSLPPRRDSTLQGFTDQMESSVNEILEKLEPVRAAAKFEAENIGHAVSQPSYLYVIYVHLPTAHETSSVNPHKTEAMPEDELFQL